jgi:hypothetical protein
MKYTVKDTKHAGSIRKKELFFHTGSPANVFGEILISAETGISARYSPSAGFWQNATGFPAFMHMIKVSLKKLLFFLNLPYSNTQTVLRCLQPENKTHLLSCICVRRWVFIFPAKLATGCKAWVQKKGNTLLHCLLLSVY